VMSRAEDQLVLAVTEALGTLGVVSHGALDASTALRLTRVGDDLTAIAQLLPVAEPSMDAVHRLSVCREIRLVADLAGRISPNDASSTNALEAAMLSERVRLEISRVAQERDPQKHAALPAFAGDVVLRTVSGAYGDDAENAASSARLRYLIAGLVFGAAFALAVLGVVRVDDGSTVDTARFLPYAIVAAAGFVLGGAVFRQASASATASREARRLERQLSGFGAFIEPLSPAVRDLVRVAMIQRFFPRLLEDDEPWKDPVWPDSDALLRALGESGRQPGDLAHARVAADAGTSRPDSL
jgi:hypothetical protein